jgi:hypothetical protein
MKRWLAIAGLVVLALTLVFLNQGMKKAAAPDKDEDEAPAQAQKAPIKTAPIDPNGILPAEETLGDIKTAHQHIQLGWVYTDNYYKYPENLNNAIQAVRDYVRNSNGRASAEIVDLDVPLEDRSPAAREVTDLGMQAAGQVLYSQNPTDAPVNPQQVTNYLDGILGK